MAKDKTGKQYVTEKQAKAQQLMRVTAYQCKYCSVLFTDQNKCNECEKSCARLAEQTSKKRAEEEKAEELSHELRLSVSSIQEIPDAISEIVKRRLNRVVDISTFNVMFSHSLLSSYCWPCDKDLRGREKYCGWTGNIAGVTDLSKNPTEFMEQRIDSIFNIFGRFSRRIISGIHFGTGSGGDHFQASITILLDDFPKIKEKYTQYDVMKKQIDFIESKRDKLISDADDVFIKNNQKIKDFDSSCVLLKHTLKETERARVKFINTIFASKEYESAVFVPEEKDFDYRLYDQLGKDLNL